MTWNLVALQRALDGEFFASDADRDYAERVCKDMKKRDDKTPTPLPSDDGSDEVGDGEVMPIATSDPMAEFWNAGDDDGD